MNDKLRQRLLQVFQAEHAEHLRAMRQFLEQAENKGITEEALNTAFRHAHSLKGASRAVDLPLLQTLAHHIESVLARVQSGKLTLEPDVFVILHQVLDLSEKWLQALQQQQSLPETHRVLNAIEKLLGLELTAAPADEATPVAVAAALPEPPAEFQASTPSALEHLRISALQLEQVLQTADRLHLETLVQAYLGKQFEQVRKQWRTRQYQSQQPLDQTSVQQELQIHAQQLRVHQQSVWRLGQEVRQLQQSLRDVQMVPAYTLFEHFPQMVRTLAQEEHKQVRCQFSGLEIEVDRNVLQALKDPVMHLLRNAVAHGIELPEVREQKGKNPQGEVSCRLKVEGNTLNILISDDGQGLQQAEILKKAEAQGKTTPQWQELIFTPGFSTAREVTSLHGRGMGLSVVAETISRLQGEYAVHTGSEGGLQLQLKVPLHLTTSRLLLVRCAEAQVAIPLAAIAQVLRLPATEIEYFEATPHLRLNGTPIQLLSLPQLLFESRLTSGEQLAVLVLKSAKAPLAIAVDEVLRLHESLLKPLTGPAAELPLFLGAVQSEQGRIIPVLDPQALLAQTGQHQAFEMTAQPVSQPQVARILVVDDSITTRTLEKGILEMQGYEVEVAVNGQDALNKLQSANFDLVLSDIQMPVMDGMQLLATLKQDPDLNAIPVVVVTSLDAPHEKARGLELGAAAYLVKQHFDPVELIEIIQQWI